MCLYFIQKDFVMNIPVNTQQDDKDNFNPLTAEKCRQCEDVLPIQDLDPNYEGIVSTHSNDSYCKFSCISENDETQ